MSTTRPTPKLNFGKIDCSTVPAEDLCNAFFLTAPFKLPVFYHIVTFFNNGTSEIRRVPSYRNLTEANEQPAYIAKFHTEKKWQEISPWTGVFNPIDGALKDYSPILAPVLRYYEMIPQWIFMIGISFLGRSITYVPASAGRAKHLLTVPCRGRFTRNAPGPNAAQRHGAPPA
jgi:hypothetical protein